MVGDAPLFSHDLAPTRNKKERKRIERTSLSWTTFVLGKLTKQKGSSPKPIFTKDGHINSPSLGVLLCNDYHKGLKGEREGEGEGES